MWNMKFYGKNVIMTHENKFSITFILFLFCLDSTFNGVSRLLLAKKLLKIFHRKLHYYNSKQYRLPFFLVITILPSWSVLVNAVRNDSMIISGDDAIACDPSSIWWSLVTSLSAGERGTTIIKPIITDLLIRTCSDIDQQIHSTNNTYIMKDVHMNLLEVRSC